MSVDEEKAIDILSNVIADEVIGTYCTEFAVPKYNCRLCIDENGKDDDCYYEKAIDTVLNLIKKQQKEIEKENKIIDKMADEMINGIYKFKDKRQIIEYFTKKVGKENE